MSSSASVEGARRALSQFAAGVQLLKILDKRPAHESDVVENLVCTAARLAEEAASSGAAGASEAAGVVVAKVEELDPSTAKCIIPDLSFNTPWGKYTLMWFEKELVLKSAKAEVRVPVAAIKQIAILDRFPKDTKERVVIFIVLDKSSGVMSGKHRLESLVLQMLADTLMRVQIAGEEVAQEGPAPVVLCSIMGRASSQGAVFLNPDEDVYSSVSGAPCLAATYKANAGWLYPLEGALCFVERPPMFLSHDDIASYELQRAEGLSLSFELVLRMAGPKTPKVEFNIVKNELGRLQTYLENSGLPVHGSAQAAAREARGKDGGGGGGGETGPSSNSRALHRGAGKGGEGAGNGGDEGDDEEDEDEEDEDFDPEASDQSGGWKPPAAGGGASSSRAGRAAAKAGNEEASDEGSSGDDEEDEGSDDEDEEDEDEEAGSEDFVSEEDVPKSALKARMVKEKVEAKGVKRKQRE